MRFWSSFDVTDAETESWGQDVQTFGGNVTFSPFDFGGVYRGVRHILSRPAETRLVTSPRRERAGVMLQTAAAEARRFYFESTRTGNTFINVPGSLTRSAGGATRQRRQRRVRRAFPALLSGDGGTEGARMAETAAVEPLSRAGVISWRRSPGRTSALFAAANAVFW